MKILQRKICLFFVVLLLPTILPAQDAKDIVRRADTKYNGEKSSYSEMTMTIVRPKYKRSVQFKNWAQTGGDALTLITAPAKEKGQSFLKSGNNLWSWNPTIQRLIKLPPSMMSQGWMGSDFSNDDILKESSLVKDYTHRMLKTETVSGLKCYKIELTPLEEAGVVWGKINLWISVDEYFELKSEFYDEDGYLVKTHLASKIITLDDRRLPSFMEIIPADEPGNKTVVIITKMKFNIPIADHFFTQQNMKRVK
ncbi:MAG: outer membrane lipoprotein-sorting protein [Bacteroidales bacterium]|nr:outer membrane lipoprotein-sorting protein [Bacteroidales bacterium]MDD4713740.1 outer membrane lipoprotein-sorting protein [Bacteroidales bacterium]